MNTLSLGFSSGGITVDFECGGETSRVIFSMCSGTKVGGCRKLFLKCAGQHNSLALGPVKTKRKVTVTSFTGIVTTNLVSHCSDGPFYTSSSPGSWGSSLPVHPSSRPDSQDKIQA